MKGWICPGCGKVTGLRCTSTETGNAVRPRVGDIGICEGCFELYEIVSHAEIRLANLDKIAAKDPTFRARYAESLGSLKYARNIRDVCERGCDWIVLCAKNQALPKPVELRFYEMPKGVLIGATLEEAAEATSANAQALSLAMYVGSRVPDGTLLMFHGALSTTLPVLGRHIINITWLPDFPMSKLPGKLQVMRRVRNSPNN
jgi:hypothetical protein